LPLDNLFDKNSIYVDYCLELKSFSFHSFPYLISLRIDYFDTEIQISTDMAMNFPNLREIALSSSMSEVALDFSVFLICTKLEKISLFNFLIADPHIFRVVPNLTHLDIQHGTVDVVAVTESLPSGLRELHLSVNLSRSTPDIGRTFSRFQHLRVLSWVSWQIFAKPALSHIVCLPLHWYRQGCSKVWYGCNPGFLSGFRRVYRTKHVKGRVHS
jgi:hypothetical protein